MSQMNLKNFDDDMRTTIWREVQHRCKIFQEARTALRYIVDGARYQLEAVHRRPSGELDDTYEDAHDALIAHLLEEMESVSTFKDMEANEEGFGERVNSLE